MAYPPAVAEFFAQKRIAVVGVSREKNQAANFVYRKLKNAGHEVVPVNPNAETVEGDPCFPDLSASGADAAALFTHPRVTADVVRQCRDSGVRHVWIHRGIGRGSWSEEAERVAREASLSVIPGACPAMFLEPDIGHRCMRWIKKITGSLPEEARDES